MANLTFTGILEKMTGKDKDYRYMATSDLLQELNKEGLKLDSDLEAKLSNIVIQQLDDAAGDISGLAVKCIAPLVKKVREQQVSEMANKLCDKLLNGKEQHRDIASIALKTLVAEVPTAPTAQSVIGCISPKLVRGIAEQGMSTDIKCECLDILCDVLHKYGNLMAQEHEVLLRALLPQLSINQASVRKKAVTCIAALASSLSDDYLAKANVEIVKLLKKKATKSDVTRTNIQMIGALSRSVGYRFGPHLGDSVPLLINYCNIASENDEELREYSLQALESFLLRCHRDISIYCDQVLHLALDFLSYDPNFTDNMEEDTDEESYVDEEEDESANEYTDDEDVSWKVRRAAAKCLAALIVSRPEMLSRLYEEACPKLIDRFKEREENVKMDVFNTFIELLRQTGNVTKGLSDFDESSPRYLLKQEVPKIVRSVNKQLREKSVKTKVGAFSILKELVMVLPDCLADHIGSLTPGIEKALCDKSSTSNLKIEALVFTRLVLASHAPSVFHPYIKAISVPVMSAVGERYYKVTAEALRVCGELVRVVRPNIEGYVFDFKPYVHPIYSAIMSRLTNQDQDQEVKECAISCMGLVVSTFGDHLGGELSACLPVLVDRMGNEITRLTAVKAFSVIAASPLHLDLSFILDHVISELTAFLRKANRALRQATLGTLNTLIVAYGDKIGSAAYEVIVVELSTLISDSDLHMAALALELCCTLMADRRSGPSIGQTVRNRVLPQSLSLLKSSLLQGQTLLALQNFFSALVYSANTSFDLLLDSLLATAKSSASSGAVAKQALSSIAQCVAVLCLAAGDTKCFSTVKMLLDILKADTNTNSAKQHLALLCLGEIGRRKDLSSHDNIETIVIDSFQSPFEEIKSAASYALGNIAVGNLPKYLPFILDKIDNQQKKQYLLLHSLKEVIVRQSVDKAEFDDSSVEKITKLLFNHCESEEDGVRNVVAECLGKMALIEPGKLVHALKERIYNHAAFTRATVVIAVKYSIAERQEKIDEVLYSEISAFLMLIKDNDRHVRRAAVLALNTPAHNKPSLIKGLLLEILPLLYDQTIIKKEWIRTVDLGPFRHTVDDGLKLWKAVFECVDTLLDNCLDQANPSSFIVPFLLSGLDDHYDVKMPCRLILSKLADKCPSAVLAVLDSLVDPSQKTINFRPKQNTVKQEEPLQESEWKGGVKRKKSGKNKPKSEVNRTVGVSSTKETASGSSVKNFESELEIQSIFSLKELQLVTNNFNYDNKLGEGGFGSVYWGQLWEGSQIAVKRLKSWSNKAEMFSVEVGILARVRHKNLLIVHGYGAEGQERLIVYDYMTNLSLLSHLHGQHSAESHLDWNRRMNIAIGAAEGIVYLHYHATLHKTYINIKGSNVDICVLELLQKQEDERNWAKCQNMHPEFTLLSTYIWDPGGEISCAKNQRVANCLVDHNLGDKVVFKREALSRFHFLCFLFYLNVLQLILVALCDKFGGPLIVLHSITALHEFYDHVAQERDKVVTWNLICCILYQLAISANRIQLDS